MGWWGLGCWFWFVIKWHRWKSKKWPEKTVYVIDRKSGVVRGDIETYASTKSIQYGLGNHRYYSCTILLVSFSFRLSLIDLQSFIVVDFAFIVYHLFQIFIYNSSILTFSHIVNFCWLSTLVTNSDHWIPTISFLENDQHIHKVVNLSLDKYCDNVICWLVPTIYHILDHIIWAKVSRKWYRCFKYSNDILQMHRR